MEKIIVVLSPIEIWQSVYVYKDNDLVYRSKSVSMDLKTVLPKLIEEHKVYDIEFTGAKDYSKRFGQQLMDYSVEKYGQDKVHITYS